MAKRSTSENAKHFSGKIQSKEQKASEKPTANNVKCWDSEGNLHTVTERLKEMFVEMGQKTGIEKGQKPAERAVFRKQHGIVYGNFIINKNIPKEFDMETLLKTQNHYLPK